MRGIVSTFKGPVHWRKSKRQMKKVLLKSYFDASSCVTSPYHYWRNQFDHRAARRFRNWF